MGQAPRFREHHLVLCLLIASGLLRLSPQLAAIAPIGAIALFAGAYLQRPWLWLVPLAALLAIDWLEGRGVGPATLVSYLGFGGAALLGRWLLEGNDSNRRIVAALPVAALLCWLTATLATLPADPALSLAALDRALLEALPILAWLLLAEGLYALLLFGAYKLLREAPFVYYTPQS